MVLLVGLNPLRCPDCEVIDWRRDGFSIVHAPSGDLVRRRVAPAESDDDAWTCWQCGHKVLPGSDLDRQLHETRLIHAD